MKTLSKFCTLVALVAAIAFVTPTEAKALELSSDDEYRLAKIAMAEAEAEPLEGKALVINVVLNRVKSSAWPNTVYDVLFQKGQFSPCTVDGRYYKVEPNDDCWKAVQMVEAGWDQSQGAEYFCEGTSSFHSKLTYLFQVGHHKFYK